MRDADDRGRHWSPCPTRQRTSTIPEEENGGREEESRPPLKSQIQSAYRSGLSGLKTRSWLERE
jgi:hypothetical protein